MITTPENHEKIHLSNFEVKRISSWTLMGRSVFNGFLPYRGFSLARVVPSLGSKALAADGMSRGS